MILFIIHYQFYDYGNKMLALYYFVPATILNILIYIIQLAIANRQQLGALKDTKYKRNNVWYGVFHYKHNKKTYVVDIRKNYDGRFVEWVIFETSPNGQLKIMTTETSWEMFWIDRNVCANILSDTLGIPKGSVQ